jgi:hypothetical protein
MKTTDTAGSTFIMRGNTAPHERFHLPLPWPVQPSGVQTLERRLTAEEVYELLAAAGPLTARDIAGGIDLPMGEVGPFVAALEERGQLRRDEFERYRLWGEAARAY